VPDSVGSVDWAPAIEAIQPKAVFHLAAITDTTVADEREMLSVNTETFGDLLRSCADADVPLVYAASAATYGSPACADDRVPFPTQAAGSPNNVYGFSKWLMEVEHQQLQDDRADSGREPAHVVGLRYFNVFGPGEGCKGKMASMVYQLAQQMLDGKRPRLFTDGSQARDQVYVNDVVSCTMAAAGLGERPNPQPGVYNLGSGRASSFNDILTALYEALGIDPADLPADYFQMPDSIRAFYQDFTCADMTQTKAGLGWSPAWSLHDAVMAYAPVLAAQRAGRGEPTPA